MQACIDRARAAGRARLCLRTTPSMLPAQRLCQRLGFRLDPQRDWLVEGDVPLLAYVLDLEVGTEGFEPSLEAV